MSSTDPSQSLCRLFPTILTFFAVTQPVGAQSNGVGAAPEAAASRVSEPIVVDGALDEPAWAAATALERLVQHEPLEGRPPTQRTAVRILFDDEAVYIGVRLYDTDPSAILFGENRRDADLQNADAVLFVFDTFLDRQNGYVFGTTPAGIEYDGQVTQNGQGGLATFGRQQAGAGAAGGFNLNWDGSWEVATSIDADGWIAEFRIPFGTFRYGAGGEQRWGFNVSRTIRRNNEEDFWAPVSRQFDLYRVSDAGTLAGIQAPARRTVRVTPYALSSASRDFTAQTDTDFDADFGADAKIGITPSLNLDLTVNTDFAQVEADDQQINLTRFSLFFPEKRPFFLENAGTFTVGTPRAGSEQGLDLFYSRRIGIGPDGQPVPIVGGGRITGKLGGLTVGLLDIQTQEVAADTVPANNYGVARVLKELPNRSRIGAMFITRLDTEDSGNYNLTYSVDGRWGIGSNLNLDGYVARTETPGRTGREHGMGFTGAYESRNWSLGGEYREIGEDFNPEVGFLPRMEYRAVIGRIQRNIRVPTWTWLREWRPHVLLRNFFDFDGFNLTRYLHIDNAIEFAGGGTLSTAVNFRREGLTEPFEISEGVIVPSGTYDFVESRVRFSSNQSEVWSAMGDVTIGGLFDGNTVSATGTITNRVGATWAGAVQVRYDNVDLPQGSFETLLLSVRVAYSFTPRIFLQGLFQYNTQRDQFTGNVRFGWLNTAGTGLFLVYNETQRTLAPTGPTNRVFIVKFTHQFDVMR